MVLPLSRASVGLPWEAPAFGPFLRRGGDSSEEGGLHCCCNLEAWEGLCGLPSWEACTQSLSD